MVFLKIPVYPDCFWQYGGVGLWNEKAVFFLKKTIMKKLFSLLAILISVTSYATLRTVCNTPSTLAQFNNIQAAVDACNTSGDTIYVTGSPNAYVGFTITDKQITIIGPGWAPNKNLPLIVTINSACAINGAASSGTELQGLVFNNQTVTIQGSTAIINIRIIRNQFMGGVVFSFGGGTSTYSGYLFEGNFFNNSQIQNESPTTNSLVNFIFQNNLFFENGSVGGNITNFNSCVNVLFNHNLFYGPSSGATDVFGGTTSQFLSLNNNIFVRRDAANASGNNTFTNNITFNAGDNTPWASNSNIDAGGNISNQDPQMVDQTSVNNGVGNPLLDFTIAAGPANNSGSDNKDMGLLYDAVGSLNWVSSRTSFLPYIYSMNIINPTIPAGGTLNVTVEARKDN